MSPDSENIRVILVLSWMSLLSTGIVGSSHPVEVAYSMYDRLRHIHEAPLQNLRHSFWWVRKTFFTRPRTPTPSYLIDMTKPDIIRLFGRHYFEPGWGLSYNYHGEVLNLRRVEYVDEDEYNWWQVHIRGYLHKEGIELTSHYETEPAQHPDEHVNLHGLDIKHGMTIVGEILKAEGVDYRRIEPEEHPEISDGSLESPEVRVKTGQTRN